MSHAGALDRWVNGKSGSNHDERTRACLALPDGTAGARAGAGDPLLRGIAYVIDQPVRVHHLENGVRFVPESRESGARERAQPA